MSAHARASACRLHRGATLRSRGAIIPRPYAVTDRRWAAGARAAAERAPSRPRPRCRGRRLRRGGRRSRGRRQDDASPRARRPATAPGASWPRGRPSSNAICPSEWCASSSSGRCWTSTPSGETRSSRGRPHPSARCWRQTPTRSPRRRRPSRTGSTGCSRGWPSMSRYCLLVDDLQWADAPSAAALEYVARRLEGHRMLLVCAARDDEPGTDGRRWVQEIEGATTLRLDPLSERACAQLVERSLGTGAAPFAAACHRVTAGNPRLVVELLRACRDAGIAPDAAGAARIATLAPAAVAPMVLARIRRLGPDAEALARAVAILEHGRRADAAALAAPRRRSVRRRGRGARGRRRARRRAPAALRASARPQHRRGRHAGGDARPGAPRRGAPARRSATRTPRRCTCFAASRDRRRGRSRRCAQPRAPP